MQLRLASDKQKRVLGICCRTCNEKSKSKSKEIFISPKILFQLHDSLDFDSPFAKKYKAQI